MSPTAPMVSYVVTCRDRQDELVRLLHSIYESDFSGGHQVIVCAQSQELAQAVRDRFPEATVISMAPCSLSHARNIGVQYVMGDYVCFPDDDCYFEPAAIQTAIKHLRASPETDFLFGVAKDPDTGAIWHGLPERQRINYWNVWRAGISFNFVARTAVSKAVGNFDERLGVGAVFGAGEETDYFIRTLKAGFQGESDPDVVVLHEEKDEDVQRLFTYGGGTGAVYRKHLLGSGSRVFIVKTLLAILMPLYRCITQPARFHQHWSVFWGRTTGFFRWSA